MPGIGEPVPAVRIQAGILGTVPAGVATAGGRLRLAVPSVPVSSVLGTDPAGIVPAGGRLRLAVPSVPVSSVLGTVPAGVVTAGDVAPVVPGVRWRARAGLPRPSRIRVSTAAGTVGTVRARVPRLAMTLAFG